jgi:flagellar biogenesis protein FliO
MRLPVESFRILSQMDLAPNPPVPGGWGGGGYGVVMLILVLLVLALGAVFLYVKRFGIARQPGKGKLEILETRPLGGRQYLVVGKYGHQAFLIGVVPGRIDYLCRLESAEADMGFESALEAAQSRGPGAGSPPTRP